MLPSNFHKLLICPVCNSNLVPASDNAALLCLSCEVGFPIRNDIPILLADQALKITDQDTRGKDC